VWRLTGFLLLLSALGGCAGVQYGSVRQTLIPVNASLPAQKIIRDENRKADAEATGIRYYAPSYYLLVYPDGRGGLQWHLYLLPDQGKLLTVKPYNELARLKTTLHFQNGLLTKSSEFVDSTGLARAALRTLAEVAPALLKAAAMDEGKTDDVGNVHLYKLVFHNGDVLLRGGPCTTAVKATLNPGSKEVTP